MKFKNSDELTKYLNECNAIYNNKRTIEALEKEFGTFDNPKEKIMSFEIGKQPCNNFTPQFEGNAYGEWENRHQCMKCGGEVSFCLNCMEDHHEDGYETCITKEEKNNKLSHNELKNAAQPLIDIIYKYYNPHTTIIVNMGSVEILCGDIVVSFDVKD